MAEIKPFRAFRYDPARVQLADVLTQPYDKITSRMQQEYYSRSPHNLVRFELGKAQAGDGAASSVYTRARVFMEQLQNNGVLRLETAPAIYLYRQRYQSPEKAGDWRERTGFIALGGLHEYGEGVVFRHEQTLSGPKADRLDLLRATRTHSGQIFMLYEDPGRKVNQILDAAAGEREPDATVTDEYAVENRIWTLSDPALLQAVRGEMAGKRLIIADGHHRYETALRYRDEQRAAGAAAGAHDFVMMTFINPSAPGLAVLPTHRVVHGLPKFSSSAAIASLEEFFEIESTSNDQVVSSLRGAGKRASVLGMVTGSGAWLLKAKRESIDRLLGNYDELERRLDVMVLHKIVLEHVLGITEQDVREQKHVRYYRSERDAIAEVGNGGNAAFLMNPVPLDLLRDLTYAGRVMPQKSTDFYPKLLSGMTIFSLDRSL